MRTAFALLLCLALPLSAHAQATEESTESSSAGAPALQLPEPSPYLQLMHDADAAMVAQDFSRAESLYLRAISSEPGRPQAHCGVAAARRRLGMTEDAVEDYRACSRAARGASKPRWEGAALLGIAQTLQRAGNTIEAREAWIALISFAESYPAVLSPEYVRQRLSAHDTILELDAVAEAVRVLREQDAANATE